MTEKKEIFAKALEVIRNRRTKALTENSMHYNEIGRKIPEILSLNESLARTGKDIISVIADRKDVSQKIEKLKIQNLEAQEKIKILLVQNGYSKDYLKVHYFCDECEDSGFVNGKRCRCLDALVSNMSAMEMNRNSQINLCSFSTFDIELCRGETASITDLVRERMTNIYSYCKDYANTFSKNSDNVFMYGRTGLGKTHLSLAIANEVLKKGYNVLYDSALNYLTKIENEHFGKKNEENDDTLTNLMEADLLILDDLGTEYIKPFYVSTIYSIINTRLNRGLPTIISSNLSYEDVLKRYEERIVSRLFAAYKSLEFIGKDIRLIKRMENR